MARYDFLREDGRWVEKSFPIGTCPSEIVDDDGVRAKRGWRPEGLPALSWKEGQEPPSVLKSMSEKRRRENISSGKKGEREWRERTPKLHIVKENE